MTQSKQIVIIDILKPMILLSGLKTINLTFQNKCEIIRQTFDLMDKNFSDFSVAAKCFIKLPLVFSEQLPQHCIEEINQVCFEVAVTIYFELASLGLLNNYLPERGFPYFVEHINANSVFLQMEPNVTYFPY